jgi:hypothetical protein
MHLPNRVPQSPNSHRADKFEVQPRFLLQQAAWLYDRHLDHVRNQMKKVSGSNMPTASTTGASVSTNMGGVAMLRTSSGGSLSGRHRENIGLRGGENSTLGTS